MKIRRREVTLALATLPIAASACEERQAGGGVAAQASASAAPKAEEGGPPGVSDTEIKIGSWGPLSGPAAAWGVLLHSMNAYFKYVNEKGGVHGRKIKFIYLDDQYNPSKTPNVVRELVEKENVFLILGGIGTANGRAVADYLEKKNVPFMTPSSGDAFWSTGGKKNVYTGFPKYLTEGAILGDYIAKELKKKSVAVLYQDDDFGKQGLEGVKKGLEGHKDAKIVAEVSTQPTDTDMSGQVSKIAEAKPDVLVLYCGPKQAVPAVKALEAQKKKPQIVTSFVLGDPVLLSMAGDTWNGAISAAASKLPTSDDPSVVKYREVLQKYGGEKLPVGGFTLAGMSFAMPVMDALEKAGKDLTREKFIEAIESFKDHPVKGPYWEGEGLGPTLTFSEKQRLGFNKVKLIQAEVKGEEKTWKDLTDWLSPPGGGEKEAEGEDEEELEDEDKELMKELME